MKLKLSNLLILLLIFNCNKIFSSDSSDVEIPSLIFHDIDIEKVIKTINENKKSQELKIIQNLFNKGSKKDQIQYYQKFALNFESAMASEEKQDQDLFMEIAQEYQSLAELEKNNLTALIIAKGLNFLISKYKSHCSICSIQ